jgi:hypothetical protein
MVPAGTLLESRFGVGSPSVPADILCLIREMSIANPLGGAPRIHGELLKLGLDDGQTTVANLHGKEWQGYAGLEDFPAQSPR